MVERWYATRGLTRRENERVERKKTTKVAEKGSRGDICREKPALVSLGSSESELCFSNYPGDIYVCML